MEEQKVDVLIIGAGPIGIACGIEAVKAGLKYVIIEKGSLVNSIYHYPLYMTFFSTSDKLEIGDVPFISHHPKPTRSEALEYYRRVVQYWDLTIHLYEKVEEISDEYEKYRVKTSKGIYSTTAIIFATGFYDIPNLLNIPGEDLSKVSHYYKEAHPYFKQKILVIGGGNSAVDVALETYRTGADVTMVMIEEQIADNIKYWVKPDIENRIKEGAIKAYFGSEIVEIRDNEVDIKTPEGPVTVKNDFVLAMTGYKPNFSLLEISGIKLQDDECRTPVFDEETMETNKKNVYLAGVVCGGLDTRSWFIENSRVHAPLIIHNIRKKLIN